MLNGLTIHIPIEKKIVMNEMQQPVAVQINYQDWLKIEQQLSLESVPARRKPLCALHTFQASLTKSSKSRVHKRSAMHQSVQITMVYHPMLASLRQDKNRDLMSEQDYMDKQ